MDGKTILMVGPYWPEPDKSAASMRTMSLVQALLAAGARITFCSDARLGGASTRLASLGVDCRRLAPNDASFDTFVAGLVPQMAIFDRFTTEEKFGWRVRGAAPACLRVVDTIDLHWLRAARQKAMTLGWSFAASPFELLGLASDIAWREVAAIYRCDLALVVSDAEVDILTAVCGVPRRQLHLCRLTYLPAATRPAFDERQGFGVIGSFRHPPNEDAVQWLRAAIWPRIRQALPAATLELWGADAAPKHLALSQPQNGFYVKGFHPEPRASMLRWRVNLAPLRFGAGIKGKIADGWSCGTPVVTTPVGAEGMHEGAAFGGAVASDADSIAAAAVRLYQDRELWESTSAAGLALIDALYSPAATLTPVLETLGALLADGGAQEARLLNFTGAMLWQQGLRSTEYFSRWIEAKNQIIKKQPEVP